MSNSTGRSLRGTLIVFQLALLIMAPDSALLVAAGTTRGGVRDVGSVVGDVVGGGSPVKRLAGGSGGPNNPKRATVVGKTTTTTDSTSTTMMDGKHARPIGGGACGVDPLSGHTPVQKEGSGTDGDDHNGHRRRLGKLEMGAFDPGACVSFSSSDEATQRTAGTPGGAAGAIGRGRTNARKKGRMSAQFMPDTATLEFDIEEVDEYLEADSPHDEAAGEAKTGMPTQARRKVRGYHGKRVSSTAGEGEINIVEVDGAMAG
jgi:hypothetical protein